MGVFLAFMRHGEDTRGKCTDNPAGYYLIRTIEASTIIPLFLGGIRPVKILLLLLFLVSVAQLSGN